MIRRMVHGLSALALILNVGEVTAYASDAEGVTVYRIFVSDHRDGKITALDLGRPDARWTFSTVGQSKLYSVNNGSNIVAVQSERDTVQFINSGISLQSHGDHSDIEVADPVLIKEVLEGPRPFHVIDHDGKIAVNFDRGGYAGIIEGNALSRGEVKTTNLKQERAHHGFVAPIGNAWVTTVAADAAMAGESAPSRVGLQATNLDGTSAGDVATCTGIHGEAFSGAYLAAGCKEGILTVTAGKNGPVSSMLNYPDDLPAGQTTGTLLGARSMQIFLGNYGAKGMVIVDPVDKPHFQYVELPFRRIDFTLDPADPRFGYVLTEDGSLRQINLLTAELSRSAKVTEPYSIDGDWNDPRPRLAMAGDEIVVTDPNPGLVHRVAKDELRALEAIKIEGKPYNIAVAGGSGAVHEHSEDGIHAHSHGDPQIYKGYFNDDQVKDRPLSDYAGDWKSVYPYLQDGTLDPVWEHKAKNGTVSADEYRREYEIGYKTDVDRIVMKGGEVSFYKNGKATSGTYVYDGKEILTYKKGNRGVRFVFRKTAGDATAPEFIQFSDHKIAPEKADHYHLYWGNDRTALLYEVTNWPTYYPSSLSAKQIVREMMAH